MAFRLTFPLETFRARKRLRADFGQPRDKFNLSNDHYYEAAKEGAKHRVRQTFGQLVVQHAYPAQKLQLPFVCLQIIFLYFNLTTHSVSQFRTRLSKQEARSFHRPAMQFPVNLEVRFSKVRSAKKKKDKAGRKLGKGGDAGEALRRTADFSLKDSSNFVLWEFCVSGTILAIGCLLNHFPGGTSADCLEHWDGECACQLLSQEE